MNGFIFDFERPIVELEKKIQEMKEYAYLENVELRDEIRRLEAKAERLRKEIYSKLTRWQRVQLARHPQRPYTLDYVERFMPDFLELHGDRRFGDDPAIVAGAGHIGEWPVMLIGHQKGRTTKEKLFRNFGMPNPEGYRKALRLMQTAAKFKRPVLALIDTPGAYPGIGAEERGQGEAIARNLFEMSHLPVPILVVVIGEGASGGALGIGVGDRILMLENTWYSVISPEGCAAILWRDAAKAKEAAEAMKVTAQDLLDMGIADEIIPEPVGGAHRNYDEAAKILQGKIEAHLKELTAIPTEDLLEQRYQRYRKIGHWAE